MHRQCLKMIHTSNKVLRCWHDALQDGQQYSRERPFGLCQRVLSEVSAAGGCTAAPVTCSLISFQPPLYSLPASISIVLYFAAIAGQLGVVSRVTIALSLSTKGCWGRLDNDATFLRAERH